VETRSVGVSRFAWGAGGAACAQPSPGQMQRLELFAEHWDLTTNLVRGETTVEGSFGTTAEGSLGGQCRTHCTLPLFYNNMEQVFL